VKDERKIVKHISPTFIILVGHGPPQQQKSFARHKL